MKNQVFGLTDVGLKRKSNQDSIFYDESMGLFIVADGMGGHQGGDIASQMTVAELPKIFKEKLESIDQLNFETYKTLATECINKVNLLIYSKAQEEPQLEGMGTTLVMAYRDKHNLYLSNIGDSRAYLYNGSLYQLTRDHSMVQEKINYGIYTREQGRQDKQKNILTRSLGFEPTVESEHFHYELKEGDSILLCSDGLHGMIPDEDILHAYQQPHPSPKERCEELVALAKKGGGSDNVSVIIF